MSQTETILLVVLGFSLASLIALFIGRMMWSMAVRIGARRMQRQVPSSVVGLQTERDRLRAEYAMLSQRMLTRIDAMKLAMAEHMAEVSRHRNRLEQSDKDAALRAAEMSALRQENDRLTKDLQQARADEAELRALLAGASPRNAYSPGPGAVSPPPEPEPAPVPPADDDVERLRKRIERLNRMASTVARERTSPALPETIILPPPPPPSDPLVIEKLKEAERSTDDLARELERLDREWSHRLKEENSGSQPDAPTGPQADPQEDGGAPKENGPSSMAMANVISLANRIRDLRKGMGKP